MSTADQILVFLVVGSIPSAFAFWYLLSTWMAIREIAANTRQVAKLLETQGKKRPPFGPSTP